MVKEAAYVEGTVQGCAYGWVGQRPEERMSVGVQCGTGCSTRIRHLRMHPAGGTLRVTVGFKLRSHAI